MSSFMLANEASISNRAVDRGVSGDGVSKEHPLSFSIDRTAASRYCNLIASCIWYDCSSSLELGFDSGGESTPVGGRVVLLNGEVEHRTTGLELRA